MDVQSVLTTLRRVPDDIVLAVASRDIDAMDGECCICGWAVREAVARFRNVAASDVVQANHDDDTKTIPQACAVVFGGTLTEWGEVFWGIGGSDSRPLDGSVYSDGDAAIVEAAFVLRVDEAVNPPRKRRAKTKAA